jgi:hypothetical protein
MAERQYRAVRRRDRKGTDVRGVAAFERCLRQPVVPHSSHGDGRKRRKEYAGHRPEKSVLYGAVQVDL